MNAAVVGHFLSDLGNYDFLQRAFLAGSLVGVGAPLVGLYLVLRRLALIGDGLGHTALAGTAAAWLVGGQPLAGSVAAALAGAAGVEAVSRRMRGHDDAALAMLFYGALALAAILISLSPAGGQGLQAALFGSILTVSASDLVWIAAVVALTLVALAAMGRGLFLAAWDEEAARAEGWPVDRYRLALVLLTALTVAVGMRVVGVLLIAALLTLPAIGALLGARSFREARWAAATIGLLSVWLGIAASDVLNLAPGGTIVLAALLLTGLFTSVGRLRAGRA
ncbi:MAG: metal ABC transporter permease [Bacillota bacterium]|nr:metal ABC transporter permease [Bacillota bacterium]